MKVEVFKALDNIFCEPNNPIWSEIIKDGQIVGYRMENMIQVCKQHQFVTAIPNPDKDRSFEMLVFGKYPVYGFYLNRLAVLILKQ